MSCLNITGHLSKEDEFTMATQVSKPCTLYFQMSLAEILHDGQSVMGGGGDFESFSCQVSSIIRFSRFDN